MSHVFISYQQADGDFASLLMFQLEKAGITTWLDKQRLRPGYDWSEAIDAAIRDSYAMIVVMSPEAKASEYVTYEWAHAIGAGVRVVPVLIRETVLHPRLARIQYLKFTDQSLRPWDALIQEVREEEGAAHSFRITRTTPTYIQRAIADLDSANPEARKAGIQCLADSEEHIAREALSYAQKHPLKDVRVHATVALARGGDSRALIGMAEALMSTDEAADAILELRTNACPFVVQSLDDTNDLSLRVICARLARRLPCPDAIPALSRALDGPPSLKAEAITALTHMHAELVIAPASAALTAATDERVESAAIAALVKFAPPNAVSLISTFLLAELERAAELAELERAAEEPFSLRSSAYTASNGLKKLADCTTIKAVAEHLGSPNPSVRILIAQMVGEMKCTEYVSSLTQLLADEATGTLRFGPLGMSSQVKDVARDALKSITVT